MTRSEYWGSRRQFPRGGAPTKHLYVWRSQGQVGTSVAQPMLYYIGRPGGARLWQWSSVGRPQFPQTSRTVFHRYEIRLGSPLGGKAYVWQSAGSGGATVTGADYIPIPRRRRR